MTDRLERNKQNATGFYDLMFNQCKPAEAVSKLVTFGDDALEVHLLARIFLRHPLKVCDERLLAIGHVWIVLDVDIANYVVLHCYQQWPGDQHWAGIDIFRLDADGKIVEHWDVLQLVPEKSANSNTMF